MNSITTKLLAVSCMASLCVISNSQALNYRLTGRSNTLIVFGPNLNDLIDETNGRKEWIGYTEADTGDHSGTATIGLLFGQHSCKQYAKGTFANTFCEGNTYDDIKFSNPTGQPVAFSVTLSVQGRLYRPTQASFVGADCGVFVNGEAVANFSERWIGNTYSKTGTFSANRVVPNGTVINLRQYSRFQLTGLNGTTGYSILYGQGFAVGVTILTPGATMTTGSGSTYPRRGGIIPFAEMRFKI